MMNVIYSLENVGKDSEKLCTTRNPRFLLELAASFCLPFSGFVFLMMKSNYEMRSSTGPEVGEVNVEDSTQESKHEVEGSGEDRTDSNVAWASRSSN